MTEHSREAPERLPEDRVATITATVTSCPKIDPYVTARGGVVVVNGPFPRAKADAVYTFIKQAQDDIVALLGERVALLAENEQLKEALNPPAGMSLRLTLDGKKFALSSPVAPEPEEIPEVVAMWARVAGNHCLRHAGLPEHEAPVEALAKIYPPVKALQAETEQLRLGPTETDKPVDVRVRVLALSPSDAADGLAQVAARLGREVLGKAGCASDGYSQAWYRWTDLRPDGGFKQLTADDVLDELGARKEAPER